MDLIAWDEPVLFQRFVFYACDSLFPMTGHGTLGVPLAPTLPSFHQPLFPKTLKRYLRSLVCVVYCMRQVNKDYLSATWLPNEKTMLEHCKNAYDLQFERIGQSPVYSEGSEWDKMRIARKFNNKVAQIKLGTEYRYGVRDALSIAFLAPHPSEIIKVANVVSRFPDISTRWKEAMHREYDINEPLEERIAQVIQRARHWDKRRGKAHLNHPYGFYDIKENSFTLASEVEKLPKKCSKLLPKNSPFLRAYMADGKVRSIKWFSKRLVRIGPRNLKEARALDREDVKRRVLKIQQQKETVNKARRLIF